jgi:hypothetical protein
LIVYLLQLVVWTAFMAAVILWPAGTLAFPAAWVLVGLIALGGSVVAFQAQSEPAARAHGFTGAARSKTMGPRLAGALYFGFLRLNGGHGQGLRPYRLHGGALASSARWPWHRGLWTRRLVDVSRKRLRGAP